MVNHYISKKLNSINAAYAVKQTDNTVLHTTATNVKVYTRQMDTLPISQQSKH